MKRAKKKSSTKISRGEKLPRVIKVAKFQTGGTNIIIDKWYRAMLPGSRISINGKRYYENRRNRSDKNPREKL